MEDHFIKTLMSKYLVKKQHILILDQNPDSINKTLKQLNSTATYTINGPSNSPYDLAWVNINDKTITENVCNMLINQFPDISILAPVCKIHTLNYYAIPLTHQMYLITKKKAPIQSLYFFPPILQPYNFNMASVQYNDCMLFAFRVSNTKFHQSSILFAYMKQQTTKVLTCSNYHQDKDNSYEDPRLFIWNNKVYVMYVHINPYEVGKYTKLLLKVDELNIDLTTNTVNAISFYTPPFNKNLVIGPEKNWAFWEGPSGQLLCQYAPGHLLEWTDLEHAPRDLSKTTLPYSLRGGAPGVVYNDKVYCFCHSPNTMNLGLVVYTNTDNPTPIGIAKDIIKESDYDGAFFYVCGATITGKTWRLTGGMTDAACTIIELDADEIDSKIERLPFTS